jgi:cytochrome P450
MVNAWAMARSPMHWGEDAEEFRPERFEDGGAQDYNGTQYEYLPFGSGRRMCPGGNFGLATLELITVRLLYYFDWSLPAGVGPDELDMEMIVTGTARRRSSLHLVPSQYKIPVMEIQPCSL